MLYSGKTNIQIIEILGFYIVIAFRTIPGASKLIAALQNLKFDSSSIETILYPFLNEDFQNNYKDSNIKKVDLSKIFYKIELKNLNFKFKEKDNFVLKNINLKIEKGDFIGILGPSGSGKTVVAEAGIYDALKNGKKVLYTSPIKDNFFLRKFPLFLDSIGQRLDP